MPRLEHEPWCEDHDRSIGREESGQCFSAAFNFGPSPANPDILPDPIGSVGAFRSGQERLDVYVDFNTTSGGVMDVDALRAVREAVAESPADFLAALDRLIETLGTDVPSAHTVRVANRQPSVA